MPKFKVRTPIMHGGKTYRAGDSIDLDKEDALKVSDALINPPVEKAASKELEAALRSQRERPNPDIADWKVPADVQAARRAAREAGEDAGSAASETAGAAIIKNENLDGPPTAPAGPSSNVPPPGETEAATKAAANKPK